MVISFSNCAKENGKLHICVDYQKLNAQTKKDPFLLPFLDSIFDSVAGHEMYSFMDGYRGYKQVKMVKEDKEKTIFILEWVAYAYNVMPFGLCNALATFQKVVTKTFKEHLNKFTQVFLDDFSVYGSKMDHIDQLQKCLEEYRQNGTNLNLEKCAFCVNLNVLLGHIVCNDGLLIDPKKITTITTMPVPINVIKI